MLDLASFSSPRQLDNSVSPLDSSRANRNLMTDVSNPNNDGSGRHNHHQHQLHHPHRHLPNPADEFHLSIPAYLTQHGRSLAHMNQKALSDCLQPVLQSLKGLNAESLLNLERVENGARLCDGINVRPIHDEVFPKYDCFGPGSGFSCVRYIHITEVPEQYSIGIFVFPPFSRIPLHDHPEMCVLSRLLYGDLQCLSLDLPGASPDDTYANDNNTNTTSTKQLNSPNQSLYSSFQAMRQGAGQLPDPRFPPLPPGLPEGSRRAFKNSVKHLHAPDVSMLFPYKGNLHEFFAGPNGAAVLDILLPPYDIEHERDCTFYDIREDQAATAAQLHHQHQHHHHVQQSSQSNPQQPSPMMLDEPDPLRDTDDDERTPCWIVPTGQPHDFHCLSGQYAKLGANVLAMQR